MARRPGVPATEAALQRLEGSVQVSWGLLRGSEARVLALSPPTSARMCGISHTLAWCSKRGVFHRMSFNQFFLENCEEGVIFNLALQPQCYGWMAAWKDSKPVTGDFIQRGAHLGGIGNSLGDSEQGPANLELRSLP